MSFKDKVVIVTGASSGIGAATAVSFAREGAKVVMVGTNTAKLNRTAAKCERDGSRPLVIAADVAVNNNCKRIIDETLKAFSKLDVLVNNAGIYKQAGILDSNAMETFDSILAINLNAVVYLTHLATPYLIETKGNIVNVSSVGSIGVIGESHFAYLTSKAALDHFSRAIALELAPKGIRVNTVNPGSVKTDLIARFNKITNDQSDAMYKQMEKQLPLGKLGEPEEIADLVLFLASDKARGITGSTFVSDNGTLLSPPNFIIS